MLAVEDIMAKTHVDKLQNCPGIWAYNPPSAQYPAGNAMVDANETVAALSYIGRRYRVLRTSTAPDRNAILIHFEAR
jgi:uncharacterized protein (DUF2252 family)